MITRQLLLDWPRLTEHPAIFVALERGMVDQQAFTHEVLEVLARRSSISEAVAELAADGDWALADALLDSHPPSEEISALRVQLRTERRRGRHAGEVAGAVSRLHENGTWATDDTTIEQLDRLLVERAAEGDWSADRIDGIKRCLRDRRPAAARELLDEAVSDRADEQVWPLFRGAPGVMAPELLHWSTPWPWNDSAEASLGWFGVGPAAGAATPVGFRDRVGTRTDPAATALLQALARAAEVSGVSERSADATARLAEALAIALDAAVVPHADGTLRLRLDDERLDFLPALTEDLEIRELPGSGVRAGLELGEQRLVVTWADLLSAAGTGGKMRPELLRCLASSLSLTGALPSDHSAGWRGVASRADSARLLGWTVSLLAIDAELAALDLMVELCAGRPDILMALLRAVLIGARRGARLSLDDVTRAWSAEEFAAEAATIIGSSLGEDSAAADLLRAAGALDADTIGLADVAWVLELDGLKADAVLRIATKLKSAGWASLGADAVMFEASVRALARRTLAPLTDEDAGTDGT